MTTAYDTENIFAKILRGEIPNDTVVETEHSLAFKDIAPKAPVHVLVIPRGAYVNAEHFGAEASEAELADFARTVARVTRETGIAESVGGQGFRTISNAGSHGVQEVPHYHVHVLGGRSMGRMVGPSGG